MRAVVMRGPGELVVEEVTDPSPAPGEAVIEVEHCGICGSDLFTVFGNRKLDLPRILGHEFAGRIQAINGGDAYPFRVGDRVVAEPFSGCGICLNCRKGDYNVCEQRAIIGIEREGAFARYVRVPLNNLFPMPDDMPFREAALVQPVAVTVHAFRRTSFRAGWNVAILGAGPIGALLAMVARASGAALVVLSEPNGFRKKIMEDEGFPVIDPAADDIIPSALSMLSFPNKGFDLVIDAAGGVRTLSQAAAIVRICGQVVPVAKYKEKPIIDMNFAQKRELEFVTARAHSYEDFQVSVALVANRQIDVRPLISDEIDLAEMPEAFRVLKKGGNMMKVLGKPGGLDR